MLKSMIYTHIPEHVKLDLDLFQIEKEFYYENLPPQEKTKLAQFTSSSLCGTFYVDIHKPAAPVLWNLHLNLVDKEPTVNKQRYSSKYVSLVVDKTLYDYTNNYNFFPQTTQVIKANKNINSVSLLYFKPHTVLPCHVHEESEYIAHFLLNDTKNGCLDAYSENCSIKLNKRGDCFMHETNLPHGGRSTESEVWVLSVTTSFM
jgi:hypothetical protein